MAQQTNDVKILQNMIQVIKKSKSIYRPSLFWENLNKINLKQLHTLGYSNFKRSINQNYFNFLVTNPLSNQFRSVFFKWLKNPKFEIFCSKFNKADNIKRFKQKIEFNVIQRFFYKLFISMLWEYTKTVDKEKLLDVLEEPAEGNPLRIIYRGKLISQDLCNSILEYYSIVNTVPHMFNKKVTIAELGGGYGRCAFVFLKAMNCKYVIFDIPPALYISQKYLSSIFPSLKIFKFREFNNYSEIKAEYEQADLCFFTPNQIEFLPKDSFNIFINISSFQEMTFEQIKYYFYLINKYCNGYFYTKQWLNWKNPRDKLLISYKNYPIPKNWKLKFFRKHAIQRKFFEAMYEIIS